MWNQIAWSIELVYLAACTKSDVRGGWISVPLSVICMGTGILLRCIMKSFGVWSVEEIMACVLPGIIVGIVSWLSRGGFGMGDVWMIAVSACLLESADVLLLVWYAFLFAGIYSVILVMCKKKGRKDSFAFAPCMLAAYVIGLIRGNL